MVEQPTCRAGSKTDHPCPHPATEGIIGECEVCEGHRLLIERGEDEDNLRDSIAHLERWIRIADRLNIAPLRKGLRTLRDGLGADISGIEAKQREIRERYSLPASAAEQPPKATRAQEEPLSEAERRWLALDRRASRFTNAAGSIEQEEIYELQMRYQAVVVPLLEEEAERAEEEAQRVKAEFGL